MQKSRRYYRSSLNIVSLARTCLSKDTGLIAVRKRARRNIRSVSHSTEEARWRLRVWSNNSNMAQICADRRICIPLFIPLPDIFKINDYLTALFIFQYLNNLSDFFKTYFLINNQIHEHNTRNASKLHKCYKRANYVKHTLSNKGVDVWINLKT
jgi:hypothetical protein